MKGGGRQRRFEGAGKLRPEQMKGEQTGERCAAGSVTKKAAQGKYAAKSKARKTH